MNSELLDELAWLFKIESMRENSSKRGDPGEAMRLFCISLEIEERAHRKRRAELEQLYAGDIE
jgi:hypothetical protein